MGAPERTPRHHAARFRRLDRQRSAAAASHSTASVSSPCRPNCHLSHATTLPVAGLASTPNRPALVGRTEQNTRTRAETAVVQSQPADDGCSARKKDATPAGPQLQRPRGAARPGSERPVRLMRVLQPDRSLRPRACHAKERRQLRVAVISIHTEWIALPSKQRYAPTTKKLPERQSAMPPVLTERPSRSVPSASNGEYFNRTVGGCAPEAGGRPRTAVAISRNRTKRR